MLYRGREGRERESSWPTMRRTWCGGCGAYPSCRLRLGLGFQTVSSLRKLESLRMRLWWEARLWRRLSGIADGKQRLWENLWESWSEVTLARIGTRPLRQETRNGYRDRHVWQGYEWRSQTTGALTAVVLRVRQAQPSFDRITTLARRSDEIG